MKTEASERKSELVNDFAGNGCLGTSRVRNDLETVAINRGYSEFVLFANYERE